MAAHARLKEEEACLPSFPAPAHLPTGSSVPPSRCPPGPGSVRSQRAPQSPDTGYEGMGPRAAWLSPRSVSVTSWLVMVEKEPPQAHLTLRIYQAWYGAGSTCNAL